MWWHELNVVRQEEIHYTQPVYFSIMCSASQKK